jgi:hypothetical protein
VSRFLVLDSGPRLSANDFNRDVNIADLISVANIAAEHHGLPNSPEKTVVPVQLAGEVYARPDHLAQWTFAFNFEKVLVFSREPGGGGEVIELQRA